MGKTYFGAYVKERRAFGLLWMTAVAFGALVFYLYSLPWEPFVFWMILSHVVLIIWCAVDFARFRSDLRRLGQLTHLQDYSADALPLARSPKEAAYHGLIRVNYEQQSKERMKRETEDKERNDYYTMWAHQIKTPLSAMDLMLQTGDLDEEEFSQDVFAVTKYVDMALSFVRLDSESTDYVFRKCDLDKIICRAVRSYSRQFIRKKLYLHYEPVECCVLTDEKWLEFVLEQLISNALKYTMTGGVSIYLKPGVPDVLVIEDTGIGIRAEDLPRLGEKGYTGNNGRIDQRSTGIGLYLCSKILNRLSHTYTISSKPGTGTRVELNLHAVDLQIE